MKNNKKKSVNLQKCKDKTSDSEFFFKENYETAKGHHSLVAFCILLQFLFKKCIFNMFNLFFSCFNKRADSFVLFWILGGLHNCHFTGST